MPLRIIAYTNGKDVALADSLARCINARTSHMCRCVRGDDTGYSAVLFDGDSRWTCARRSVQEELAGADLIIRCTSEIAPHHRAFLPGKAVLALSHNDPAGNTPVLRLRIARFAVPAGSAPPSNLHAVTIPRPLPWWDEDYKPAEKEPVVAICSPKTEMEARPAGWPGICLSPSDVLYRLQSAHPGAVEILNAGEQENDIVEIGRRAHIIVDSCAAGACGKHSLAGLAWGAVVVNGMETGRWNRLFADVCRNPASFPFLHADPKNLERILEGLVRNGPEALSQAGHRNRCWLEAHWDFSTQWSDLWMPVIRTAMANQRACATKVELRRERKAGAARSPSLSVVIVSRNEGNYLRRTVHSLHQGLSAGDEIIVVDDQSTDGSAETLSGSYADVRVLRPERRMGVAGARNFGARYANGDVLVFSDAHIEVPKDWTAPLLDAITSDGTGAVASALLDLKHRFGKGVCGGRWRPGSGDYLSWQWLNSRPPEPYPIPLLTGGFLALRRSVFESVGGFDPGMFMYGGEDSELSVRLWTFGYQCLAVPSLLVAHRFDSPARNSVRDYKFNLEVHIHNKLRLAILHFRSERIMRVVQRFARSPGFAAAFARLTEGDAWIRRRELHSLRRYDDDWYFKRFEIPL